MEDIANVGEIEATPAMINAGAAVLCGMTTLLADEEYWAGKVYRAMCAAHSSGSCGSRERA